MGRMKEKHKTWLLPSREVMVLGRWGFLQHYDEEQVTSDEQAESHVEKACWG